MSTINKQFSAPSGCHPAVRTAAETIADSAMLESGDTVLVGVSGGQDSVALVHILMELAPLFPFRLGIAHLDHGLRGDDSIRDARFVTALAEKLHLDCHIEKRDVQRYRQYHKLSLEEAARQVRYDFYDSTAAKYGYTKIALGHHADDNAELVLMFLVRGSGPDGVSGIPPVRDGRIIRPLIRLTRQEIKEYFSEKDLSYVSDSSNFDDRFLRNRIRNHLIPELKASYNPGVTRNLNRLADIFRKEKEWLEAVITPIYEQVVTKTDNNGLRLSLTAFQEHPEAVKRRLVRKAIAEVKGNLRRISYFHIEAVLRLAASDSRRGSLDLPDRVRVGRDGPGLYVIKKKHPLRDCHSASPAAETLRYQYQVDRPLTQMMPLHVPEAGLRLEFSALEAENLPELYRTGQDVAFFDMNKLTFPLVLRNVQPGDRFRPLGMSGTQKVKKFFIDHKIPLKQRSRCPVLLNRGRIIWIVGHRIDETCRVSVATRLVLKAEWRLA